MNVSFAHDLLPEVLARVVGVDVSDVAALGAGAWSRAFAFTADDRALVARIGKHVDDFERDRVAGAFANTDLPIPHVLIIEAVPELGDGLHVCISERGTGTFIDHLDETGMRALLPSLLATFDALRAVDCSHTVGYGGWDATGNAPFPTWRAALLDVAVDHPEGRGHGWLRKLEDSRFGLDAWHTLLTRLNDAAARLDPIADHIGRHVIHNDMLNFNVLVDPARHRVSALFDWGCAMTGDPLYELACFAYWQPSFPAWARIDFVGAARAYLDRNGIPMLGFDDRLRACMLSIALGDLSYSVSIDRYEEMDGLIAHALSI